MSYLLFLKKRQNLKLWSAANYRWGFKSLHHFDNLVNFYFQLEQSLRGDSLESGDSASKTLVQQNIDLRRKLEDEHSSYKRKLQAYQDGQQRQAQLVQKLQAKVFIKLYHGSRKHKIVNIFLSIS